MHKLDSKAHLFKVRRAGELANKALKRHGKPTMSITELRMGLDEQLRDILFSEFIIKERKAVW